MNPTVYPVEELREKVRAGHHFLTTVLREPKVFIIGSDHELGRLAAHLTAVMQDQPIERSEQHVARSRACERM